MSEGRKMILVGVAFLTLLAAVTFLGFAFQGVSLQPHYYTRAGDPI